MKYTAIFAAMLAFAFATVETNAQNLLVAPLEQGESVTPVTAIQVVITVEKETVVPGPYARYAQKYLGAMPPLSGRTTHTVKSASLSAGEYTAGMQCITAKDGIRVSSNVYNPTDFVKFAIDRNSATEMTAENMARDAANTIYTLRKRRFDLISGEAGENVYGDGLRAALEEMARMEEEYVSLFMGKTSMETTSQIIEVVPEQGKTNYIVCRFSDDQGIVPETDLSAAPIVLSITPQNAAASVTRVDKKGGKPYRVAVWADCVLLNGTDPLASKRLPIFQLGSTVYGN